MTMHGIDISNFQGTVSPERAACFAQQGITCAVVRASLEDESKRDIARQQIEALQAAGIAVAVYLWCYFTEDPAALVRQALHWYGDLGVARWWLDAEEVDPRWRGTSAAQREEWLIDALACLAEAGCAVGIYTANWWWGPYMGGSTRFAGYPLWVAEYDNNPDLSVFYPFGGWTACQGKQYTGTGWLCDLGPLDLDVFEPAMFAHEDEEDDMGRIADLETTLGYVSHDVADALQSALTSAQSAKTKAERTVAYDALQAAINTLRAQQP